jgi:pimeloyl-ACP methyl ester carboxylesterase
MRYLEQQPPGGMRPRGVLVLLHAFPLNARMWEPQLVPFAAGGWRVVAPQMRGVDRGDAHPGPVSMDDYAGDIIDLLDGLRVHEAVLCGLSMGGYLALAVMRHAPRYVQGLILADSRAEADTAEAVAGRRRMQATAREKGPAAIADEMLPKILGETTRATRPEIVARARSLVLANSGESIASMLDALMSRADSTPTLATIHCPTLVLIGDEDTATPRPLSETLHRQIAGAAFAVIPHAGHLSSLEQPDAFNDAVAAFLAHRV